MNIKRCSCGAEIKPDELFCSACGAKIESEELTVSQPLNATETEPEIQEFNEYSEGVTSSSKKKSIFSNAKLWIIIGVCVVLIIALIIFVRWFTSPEQKFSRAISSGNIDKAVEIYKDGVNNGFKLIDRFRKNLSDIEKDFIDEKITYDEAIKKISDIEKRNISELNADIAKTKANIESYRVIITTYQKAEKEYELGNYDAALMLYDETIKLKPDYKDAQDKYKESKNKYISKVLSDAEKYSDADDYETAINIISDALAIIPEDETLTEQKEYYEKIIQNNHDAVVIEKAKQYVESGDYKNAVQTLSPEMATTTNPEIKTLYSKYVELYVNDCISKADEYIANKDFQNAVSIIKSAQALLPDNEALSEKMNNIESSKPVDLSTVLVINEGANGIYSKDWNVGSPKDPFENDYSGASNYRIFENNSYNNTTYYIEYRLYGKYSNLTFDLAPYTSIGETSKVYVQVYADDKLVHTTKEIGRKTDVFSVNVNIANVDYIKIVINSSYEGSLIMSNALLWK